VIRAKILATRRDNKAKVAAKSFSRPKTLKRDIKKNIGDTVIQALSAVARRGQRCRSSAKMGFSTGGASAPYKDVYNYFNITPEAVAQAAMRRCNS
jgi:transketolase